MSSHVYEATRRGINPRQAETVAKVLAAGLEELRAVGHDALTIRTVAQRAGVSPATAYTYFASKNHLFAELFLRHIGGIGPDPVPADASAPHRVKAAVRRLTDRLSEEPELSAAVTPALLGSDPDVERLRLRIGAEFMQTFQVGLGGVDGSATADPGLVEILLMMLCGALLQAGIGLMTYAEMGDQLEGAIDVILRDDA